MPITTLFASMTVADLEVAVPWYMALFSGEPDARPMDGLVEWHLDDHFGVQVFEDADEAGHSTMVLGDSDLDDRLVLLAKAGIENDGIQQATSSRILPVIDLDGNRIVFTGK